MEPCPSLPPALIPPSHGTEGLFSSQLNADTRRHLEFRILGLCDDSDSAMVAKLCEAEQMPHELPALLSRVQLTQPQAGQKGEGQQKLIEKWKMLL